jgi:hypothetical protein
MFVISDIKAIFVQNNEHFKNVNQKTNSFSKV